MALENPPWQRRSLLWFFYRLAALVCLILTLLCLPMLAYNLIGDWRAAAMARTGAAVYHPA